ncbi:MAG: hypothetical protein FK732_07240 [Asgard group archaeon]|nr:hypothetical protein [Asgard group archaeon]
MENGKIVIGEQYEIKSEIQKETRSILVSLPKGYEQTKIHYPVLFVLNASWEMNYINSASTAHYLYGSGLSPNMIVVGICDNAYHRDFMPHQGGSDDFLRFMKEELIPFIDQRFRTAPFRMLYGQSNAGLLTIYTLLTQPEIFDAYIASSPMLDWDREFVLERTKSFFKNKLKSKKYFFFNYGTKDIERVRESIPDFLEIVKTNANKELIWKLDVLEDQGHVPFSSLYDGLMFIFPDWMLSDEKIKEMNFDQLEAYYAELSKRYNFELKIPGSMLFEFAFKFLPEENYDKAIEILNKYVEIYPYSDSVYMRLGQMYYLKEDFEQAIHLFKKADELNPLSKVALNTMKLVEKRIAEEQEK